MQIPHTAKSISRNYGLLALIILLGAGLTLPTTTQAEGCPAPEGAAQAVYWGDLHVHTELSFDAYAFGSTASPRDAYQFAKGRPLTLANGSVAQIDRPLDFAAVTDHAATFDVLYLCTDPMFTDNQYCRSLRKARDDRDGRTLFNDFLLPIVGASEPKAAAICEDKNFSCPDAMTNQWQRIQNAANEANQPCEFTALIGYEWTASPGGLHWHRNVIFRSDSVPDQPFDYVRFPEVPMLWQQLDAHCKESQGCQALTIPHNINWADGGPTFDVEHEDSSVQTLRMRFERLAEVHQEKGNSECMAINPGADGADCGFERVVENAAKNRLSGPSKLSADEAWKQARSSYYRTLLNRGLQTYQARGDRSNPLMLGAIASTDNHFGLAGKVAEEGYRGSIASLFLTDEQVLGNTDFNPGGLVAVWANENTRDAIFDALHSRRAYATSGPRITLQFSAGATKACDSHPGVSGHQTAMGGSLKPKGNAPLVFTISAQMDKTPLAQFELVKGELWNGELRESVINLTPAPLSTDQAAGSAANHGMTSACVSWTDQTFKPEAPAYWYARVTEEPTPRWSKLLCEASNQCGKYPDADKMVAERAWSSPIWYLP
jgi:hypothetical protein